MEDEGSRSDVRIDVVYVSGVLPDDDLDALVTACQKELGDRSRNFLVTASPHSHSVLSAQASILSSNPLEALTALDTALHRALITTGLFDRFDVSRRMLHAGPWFPPSWA